MDKEESQVLKGTAILIMIYLHVFLRLSKDMELINLVWIQDKPLCWWLTNFTCICVSLYMFLSGYGLYISYKRGQCDFSKNVSRIIKLYKKVIFIALMFLPISLLIPSLGWDLNFVTILSTITGYNPLNCEWWFLLPWSLVCLISCRLFKVLDKYNSLICFFISLILYISVRYYMVGLNYIYEGWGRVILQVCMIFNLGFIFLMGSIFAKHNLFSLIKDLNMNRLIIGFIIILFFIRIFFIPIGLFDPFIAVSFCVLVLLLPIKKYFRRMLVCLGEQSTTMWLIHTFLIVYYFPSFFYGLKYPILIYVVSVATSYLVSYIIDNIYITVERSLKKKNE